MNNDFVYLVLEVVKEIPMGNVASYQQIATLCGRPNHSRLVGKVLSCASFYGDYPCHRVVHADGKLVVGWDGQKELLENEGMSFLESGAVDMKKYQWRP